MCRETRASAQRTIIRASCTRRTRYVRGMTAPALPHGALREAFRDVFFVTGTVKMPAPIRFSRNMTVVGEGPRLVLINSIRLSDAGLAELEKLGTVTDVVRIAGYHGADDPFYKQRYGAKISVVSGQSYRKGFDYKESE